MPAALIQGGLHRGILGEQICADPRHDSDDDDADPRGDERVFNGRGAGRIGDESANKASHRKLLWLANASGAADDLASAMAMR